MHGNWRACVYSGSLAADGVVERFLRFARPFCVPFTQDEPAAHVAVFSAPLADEPLRPGFVSDIEYPAWRSFYDRCSLAYRRFNQRYEWEDEGQPSRPLFIYSWPGDFARDGGGGCYHGTVLQNPGQYGHLVPFLLVSRLANEWHLERGGCCLHSSAVARGEDGFLFLGDSGAGKSTVSCMSASIGRPALGDDLNFVLQDPGGYRLAASISAKRSPAGYSMARPRLRGILRLVQDTRDELVPLSPRDAARALVCALRETPSTKQLANVQIERAFRTLSEVARQVPAYDLHFRKHPDFWDLIDAQLPG